MSADDDVDNVDQQELDSVLCTEQGNMFEILKNLQKSA